ncbi:MAG TPA: biopolymer transporter ExbD [Gemmatimonadota bacterium]|nr:biopolymer transporter ExbD [Gemmatimonadota bacterium]
MPKILKRKSRVSDEIPTASMADIAFLLLIFFLVTTVFAEDRGLSLVLPERQTEEVEINPKNIITFYVVGQGVVQLRRGDSPDKQTLNYEQVESIVRQELAGNPRLIVSVKTSPEANYVDMVNVLDEVKLAGATRISLQEWDRSIE